MAGFTEDPNVQFRLLEYYLGWLEKLGQKLSGTNAIIADVTYNNCMACVKNLKTIYNIDDGE